jgi:hypothetical protein
MMMQGGRQQATWPAAHLVRVKLHHADDPVALVSVDVGEGGVQGAGAEVVLQGERQGQTRLCQVWMPLVRTKWTQVLL